MAIVNSAIICCRTIAALHSTRADSRELRAESSIRELPTSHFQLVEKHKTQPCDKICQYSSKPVGKTVNQRDNGPYSDAITAFS